MATWHQMRRPVTLYHNTKWAVITDPPNGLRTSMLFETEAQATDFVNRLAAQGKAQHMYVLRPANVVPDGWKTVES